MDSAASYPWPPTPTPTITMTLNRRGSLCANAAPRGVWLKQDLTTLPPAPAPAVTCGSRSDYAAGRLDRYLWIKIRLRRRRPTFSHARLIIEIIFHTPFSPARLLMRAKGQRKQA